MRISNIDRFIRTLREGITGDNEHLRLWVQSPEFRDYIVNLENYTLQKFIEALFASGLIKIETDILLKDIIYD